VFCFLHSQAAKRLVTGELVSGVEGRLGRGDWLHLYEAEPPFAAVDFGESPEMPPLDELPSTTFRMRKTIEADNDTLKLVSSCKCILRERNANFSSCMLASKLSPLICCSGYLALCLLNTCFING